MKKYVLLMILILFSLSGCQHHSFLYGGKPIPDEVLENFFSPAIIGFGDFSLEFDIRQGLKTHEEDSETIFEWKHIGTIYKNFEVVWAYTREVGCLGKFSGILILVRKEEIFEISDIIYGGDRHANMIYDQTCQIEGNHIVFTQGVTSGEIVDIAISLNPELEERYARNSKQEISYGESGAYGCFKKAAEITSDGRVKTIDYLAYIPPEGIPLSSGCFQLDKNTYEKVLYKHDFKEGLKEIAQDLFTEL